MLRQAFQEKLKPCLVLNKIDRLVTELQLTPEEAYQQLVQILEQVNVIMATLYTEEFMRLRDERDVDVAEEELDDSGVYFTPEAGNVLFASAVDGWAFRLSQFADLWSAKLGCKAEALLPRLWGEHFFKKGTILKVNKDFKLDHTFSSLVLKPIWQLYEAVTLRDTEQLAKIIGTLGLEVSDRTLRPLKDKRAETKAVLQGIIRKWLPLAPAALEMVVGHLPSPIDAQVTRIPLLWGELPPLATPELKESYSKL